MYLLRQVTFNWNKITYNVIILPHEDLSFVLEDTLPAVVWEKVNIKPEMKITASWFLEQLSPLELTELLKNVSKGISGVVDALERTNDRQMEIRLTGKLDSYREFGRLIFEREEEIENV